MWPVHGILFSIFFSWRKGPNVSSFGLVVELFVFACQPDCFRCQSKWPCVSLFLLYNLSLFTSVFFIYSFPLFSFYAAVLLKIRMCWRGSNKYWRIWYTVEAVSQPSWLPCPHFNVRTSCMGDGLEIVVQKMV